MVPQSEIRMGPGDPPPCERCGIQLLFIMYTPAHMGNEVLTLCPVCDGGKPAAGAFGRFVADGGLRAREEDVTPEFLNRFRGLLHDWLTEAMGERGWHRAGEPSPPAG